MNTQQPHFDIKKIKVIIGLGNPGSKYKETRHNIGFILLDALVEEQNLDWHEQKNLLHAEIIASDNQKILLIKPQTFMNNSGEVLPFLTKKGIKPEEILVIHDELEKPFGSVTFRFSGSAKGHNGLRSLIEKMGQNFWRLRFGIGRPEQKEQVGEYVLSAFNINEKKLIFTQLSDYCKLLNPQE
jgi:PTH1 family peptidyl-tRNA hydrolase